MNRRRCYCPACRARDERDAAGRDARYWDVVAPLERRRLNLPAVPQWNGEPNELNLYRVTRKGNA